MSRLRVHSFGISIDGYGAGPGQDRDNPPGVSTLRQYLKARFARRDIHKEPVDARQTQSG